MARQSSSSVGTKKFSSLRSRDQSAAAQFIRDASAVRGLDRFVDFVLSKLPRLVRSEMISYNEIDLRGGRSVNWVNPAQPQERHEAWLRVMYEHPIVVLAQRHPLDRAHRLSDLMSPTQLRNTALYAEHYGPIGGLLDCMPLLWGEGGKVTSIGVHRVAKFSDREQAVINAVSEPLLRAHENARAITALERRVASLEQVVGAAGHAAIFLKPDRTPDFATTSAFEWLAKYFGGASAERLPEKLDLWVRHQVLSIDPRTLRSLGLSSRENDVLAHIANGHSNPQIGRLLGISARTVEAHVARICERLGVTNRTAAAARAFQASRAGEHDDKALQQLLEIPAPRDPLIVERDGRRLLVRLMLSEHGLLLVLEEHSPQSAESIAGRFTATTAKSGRQRCSDPCAVCRTTFRAAIAHQICE